MARTLQVRQESFPVRGVFRIARGSRTEIKPITVEITEHGRRGRGECIPYARYGATPERTLDMLEALRPLLERGAGRAELLTLLPPGAARNAVDCALWDLTAKTVQQPVWRLAGLAPPPPLTTAFTLSIDTPAAMADAAALNNGRPLLKLKLAGDGQDVARVAAVRAHAPDARLIVDANEAWRPADYAAFVPELVKLAVELIEQPFPVAEDAVLAELPRPIPVCADESCHDRSSLPRLQGLYDAVNIKLDKTGGLTEALALRAAALAAGFDIMVGCMLATSLAMAPALLVAQGARWVDLDGPLLLAEDRVPGLQIDASVIQPAPAALWG